VDPNRVTTRLIGLLLASIAAGTACDDAAVSDKTGGNVTVLRFATIDTLNPNGEIVAPTAFVDALARTSGGRMRVTVLDHYGDAAAAAESDMVTAIAAGQLDGGFPATRAFSRAGLRGLEPVEAPFTVTSYAAQKALASGPGAGRLLATLDRSGIVGLGLAVGPLRRPWSATAAITDIRHWRDVSMRTFHSPVQEAAVRALGGVPVNASYGFPDLVRSGHLQAVEIDVAQYARNGYGPLLPRLTGNVVLWPRMPVIAMSRTRFEGLTAQQRAWVRAAAQDAVRASVDHVYDDSAIAERLCRQGVRVADATPEQLGQLRRAVQPVLDRLAHDPATAGSLTEVLRASQSSPPDVLDVPASCRRSA
jgi:TRAP-type C4-dicarboxylate transport system substrate-binding protein